MPKQCHNADVNDDRHEATRQRRPPEVSSLGDDENYHKYGWGKFTPNCLQWLNNATGFLALQCTFAVVQGMLVNGFVIVGISSIEKRFGLKSSETGVVSTGYDIAFCLCTLFVTYFGSRSHQPRIVAIGCVTMAIGALVFALPHFTTPVYDYGDFTDVCANGGLNCKDDINSSQLHNYLYVFILAQLLNGAGCTSLYTLGLSFIEESVSKDKASLYLGIANGASNFGPVLGYGLGGLLLELYVDFDTLSPSEIALDSSDPRWVGAWWLGALASTGISLVVAVPLFGFPRKFPGTENFRKEKQLEVYDDGDYTSNVADSVTFGKSYQDFPKALLLLLRNVTYLFVTLAGATETMLIAGFVTFLPKIIENQFEQTAGAAALLSGVIAIPGGVVGNILAGWIVKRFNLKTNLILKLNIFYCVLVMAGAPIMFAHCRNADVTGITSPYSNNTYPTGLAANCNANCSCQEEYYMPVCGDDNQTYFSPCHAGCTSSSLDGQTYTNCSCVYENTHYTSTSGGSSAAAGACPSLCNSLPLFLGVFFVVVLLTFMTATPSLVVTFRVVPEKLRAFCLGVQMLVVRVAGGIPGPIVFGAVIDSGCILWQKRQCSDRRGSCWIYDSEELALNVFYICMACKAASILFFWIANIYYKPTTSPKLSKEENGRLEKGTESATKKSNNDPNASEDDSTSTKF